MSGSPATSDLIPLVFAASLLMALSNARGPSRRPPLIWPRSAILQSAAASSVAGIFELTVSTAQRIATFGFSNPSAHFGNVEGTLVYNAEDVTKSTVEVKLPLSGLNSFTAKFDEHLKSADFFDAAKFADATFKSTKVEAAGTNKLTVTGDLTIKGITKPVTLDVTVNGGGEHPMAKVPAAGFDATTTLKRSDFGVGAYAPNVSDEVKIRITTEATGEKPAA